MEETLSFWVRMKLAFVAFFLVLFDQRFAFEVREVRERQKSLPRPTPERVSANGIPSEPVAAKRPERPGASPPERVEALHMLAILQRDGRLLDFLSEDLAGFSDAEVGAAARTVHGGCREALFGYLSLEPVFAEPEGARVTVPSGFDAAAVRLTGNVAGNPPFHGSLRHHGWRAREVKLPELPPGQDPKILAPAEVEL